MTRERKRLMKLEHLGRGHYLGKGRWGRKHAASAEEGAMVKTLRQPCSHEPPMAVSRNKHALPLLFVASVAFCFVVLGLSILDIYIYPIR